MDKGIGADARADRRSAVLTYMTEPSFGIAPREWTETYVIANSIGMRGKTPAVRRELQRMERDGLVERRDSWRWNMLEWRKK